MFRCTPLNFLVFGIRIAMMFFLYVRFIVRFVLLFHVYAHIACVPNMKISQNSFFNFESSIASNIGAQQTTKSD